MPNPDGKNGYAEKNRGFIFLLELGHLLLVQHLQMMTFMPHSSSTLGRI